MGYLNLNASGVQSNPFTTTTAHTGYADWQAMLDVAKLSTWPVAPMKFANPVTGQEVTVTYPPLSPPPLNTEFTWLRGRVKEITDLAPSL